MPYIRIKAYPKDDKTKQKVVDEINEIFKKYWGCPESAISISMESIDPSCWDKDVREKEILPNQDKMMIFDGKKKY